LFTVTRAASSEQRLNRCIASDDDEVVPLRVLCVPLIGARLLVARRGFCGCLDPGKRGGHTLCEVVVAVITRSIKPLNQFVIAQSGLVTS
jgi:hypothetical protein